MVIARAERSRYCETRAGSMVDVSTIVRVITSGYAGFCHGTSRVHELLVMLISSIFDKMTRC